jgi:hypothetical protein
MITAPLLTLFLAGLLPVQPSPWLLSHEPPHNTTPITRETIYAWVSPEAKVPVPTIRDQHGSLIRLAVSTTPILETYIKHPIVKCQALGNAFVAPTQTRILIKVHTLLCSTISHGSIARKFEGDFVAVTDGLPGIPILPLTPDIGPDDRYYILPDTIKGILHVESAAAVP